MKLSVALFYHSLVSDWNHGNAHFLRGIASELISRGQRVRIFEPEDAWSRENLIRDYGPDALDAFHTVPFLTSAADVPAETLDLDEALDGSDLVLVHEWNQPALDCTASASTGRADADSRSLPRHPSPCDHGACGTRGIRPLKL